MGDLGDFLFTHWGWTAAGLLLLFLEVLAPGTFMLWLGIAALLTALSTFVFDLGISLQLLAFALYSAVSVILGKHYFNWSPGADAAASDLNQPATRLIGRVVTVIEPVENGRGRVKIADSPWIAEGPDMAVGTRAKIVSTEGSIVRVEPE